MSAPIGNKYNETWDLEASLQFCEDVLLYVRNNENCRSLEKACTELDGYVDLISYFARKFPDNDFRPIKVAKEIIKARLIEQGLDGVANASMAKFVLSNNHGMSEKAETNNKTELSGSVETKTTISFTKGSK